ncbi:MAG: DsrE family protein [Acidobacteriota bacterium]
MAQKTMLLTINHAPHGSVHCVEGLRAAMGMISTPDEHNVSIVFLGDGAFSVLAGVERNEAARYMATLAEWSCRLAVEKESLEAAGIRPDEIASDVEIIPRAEVLSLIGGADFVIDF